MDGNAWLGGGKMRVEMRRSVVDGNSKKGICIIFYDCIVFGLVNKQDIRYQVCLLAS